MNEFYLYEQLCVLEGIARQYPAGRAYSAQARTAANQLVSRLYRVAVIGEFKKGKSSLINALLGSEVLPTDILPMTASINRVVYGEKKSITIHYKSGTTEERTVEELLDFGTKYDAQKAERAGTVREIIVHYPSVFCRNHIELIDRTPSQNTSGGSTMKMGSPGSTTSIPSGTTSFLPCCITAWTSRQWPNWPVMGILVFWSEPIVTRRCS